jgi:putative tricarboxylic transport membrane protein
MKRELIISGFWLLLSCFGSIASYKLGLGAGGRPGPGFFPFGAAIAIGIIALVRLLRAQREAAIATFATTASEGRKIACVIAGMLAYALLLDVLGFSICTFLLIAFYLQIVALQRWTLSLGFALVVALVSHLFFDVLLNAQLPRGILASLP